MADALGNAGYAVTGSGGGGADGDYVFVDVADLDSLITEWIAIRDDIQVDRDKLWQAQQIIEQPANDESSQRQPAAMIVSLDKALDHNAAMLTYADTYVEKLTAARNQYLTDDELNASRLRGVDAR
jgi:hypothetical protein